MKERDSYCCIIGKKIVGDKIALMAKCWLVNVTCSNLNIRNYVRIYNFFYHSKIKIHKLFNLTEVNDYL